MSLPVWLKTKRTNIHHTKKLLRRFKLHSVCEESRCPNQSACFSKPTATFLILGDICTRNCGFCAVTHGIPKPLDYDEPTRVAQAVKELGLKHVVITSVTRDDIPDGGADIFAMTISTIRKTSPNTTIEVLIPDFQGNEKSLFTVVDARPDILNHNLETVKRLYPHVRQQADYDASLTLLKNAKDMDNSLITKSGIMLGLGEGIDEVYELIDDLKTVNCDILTVGQYLMPSKKNIKVVEYINPDVFEQIRNYAIKIGFRYVASAPLVRSSMNAENIYNKIFGGSNA
ncbi:MAG: lipoyl synthase [Thermodesulfovibrionales bacterium]|nr:lipoyl synthase [Thermodesulfovibrionales bacterium]